METLINLNGQTINYLKVGNGPRRVLLSPGALGSIYSDFEHQIRLFDKEKFTIVAWDPPGYGKSRPPARKFTVNFCQEDADTALSLMKAINMPKFSCLGWCNGGIYSLILAAQHPENIESIVIWGSNSSILPQELERYRQYRDINKWSEMMKQPKIEEYGYDYFRQMWEDWCDVVEEIYASNEGNICDHLLKDIECPTLIIHGDANVIMPIEHSENLANKIKKSKLKIFHNGKHNFHLKYAEEFNEIVTEFLINKT